MSSQAPAPLPSAEPTSESSSLDAPRFSWPMRLFLGYFLLDMSVRSLLLLTPAGSGWLEELAMPRNPRSLPNQTEIARCSAGTHPDGLSSASECYMASLKSGFRYFAPIPTDEIRENLNSAQDVGKYAMSWMATRLAFVGRMVGVRQDWPMFSPTVGTSDTMARLQLVYQDGSDREYRLFCDPEDLTHFSRWFLKKPLQTESRVHKDLDARLGQCRMIARRMPKNDAGSDLVRIRVFKIRYSYPSPDDDPSAFLAQQTGPPADQIDPPFWEYDVATDTGKRLK